MKTTFIILSIAVSLFLYVGVIYEPETKRPTPEQILVKRLAEARNVEFRNLELILSDFGMRITALEKRKPRTIIKHVPARGKG